MKSFAATFRAMKIVQSFVFSIKEYCYTFAAASARTMNARVVTRIEKTNRTLMRVWLWKAPRASKRPRPFNPKKLFKIETNITCPKNIPTDYTKNVPLPKVLAQISNPIKKENNFHVLSECDEMLKNLDRLYAPGGVLHKQRN